MRHISKPSVGHQIVSASRIAFAVLISGFTLVALATSSAQAASKRPVQRYTAPPTAGGLFGDFDGVAQSKPHRVYGVPKVRPAKPGTAGAKTPKTDKPVAAVEVKPIKGPLVITVSLGQQRVTVHDVDGPVAEAPISSGQPAFPTFTGVFSILEKSVVHHSNLYAGAPMPNMQRLTWSGTAMHAGDLPGYPASHGCIRLPYNFSKKLYGMTKLGTRVIVTRDALAPVPFQHAKLIAPLPPEMDAVTTGALGAPATTEASPKKVAENVDYESVRSLRLISAAVAAEEPDLPTNPSNARSVYRAARAAEFAQLEADLKSAEANKLEAEAFAKRAAAALESIKLDAVKARVEKERRAEIAKKAEQAWLESNRALEGHARKFNGTTLPTGDVMQKVLQVEEALETKTSSLEEAAEIAKRDAEHAEIARAAAEMNIPLAVKTTKESATRLTKANAAVKSVQASLESFRKAQALRKHPVSVLISRATKRLYVRQAYEPIFDVPVTIEQPDAPLGTHVFTALEFMNDDTDMRWSVVSFPTTQQAKAEASSKSKKNAQKAPTLAMAVLPGKPQTAASALDRITIPDDARERIADVLKPGSSIVVSDYGISHQTGKYTDFILLTR